MCDGYVFEKCYTSFNESLESIRGCNHEYTFSWLILFDVQIRIYLEKSSH